MADVVSIHSRPKAAAKVCSCDGCWVSFNSQPPEGGCAPPPSAGRAARRFNSQPPEGGCAKYQRWQSENVVSIHSRPKAAALFSLSPNHLYNVSIHSRPKAAARAGFRPVCFTSFNSQPPEGGCGQDGGKDGKDNAFQFTAARRRLLVDPDKRAHGLVVSIHSRPKAAANAKLIDANLNALFQFTAARRRLPARWRDSPPCPDVSIHSRPKAAACGIFDSVSNGHCFNSQPPEGGCGQTHCIIGAPHRFNSQPPEGGCDDIIAAADCNAVVSIHSRPKAAARSTRIAQPSPPSFNSQPPEGGCWNI